MGTGIGAGAAVDKELSPCCAAIEQAQAELRQEVAVRKERWRELEFLEKGGNPLDFKFGEASVTLQSPISSDQLAEHFLPSREKSNSSLGTPFDDDSVEDAIGDVLHSKESLHLLSKISLNAAGDPVENSDDHQPIADGTAVGFSFSDHQQHIVEKKEVDCHGGARGGVKDQYERRNRSRSNRYGNGHTAKDAEETGIGDTSPTSSFGAKGSLESSTEVRDVGDENETQGTQMELHSDVCRFFFSAEKKNASAFVTSPGHLQECKTGEMEYSDGTCANASSMGDQNSSRFLRPKILLSPNDQDDASNVYPNNMKVSRKVDSLRISDDQENDVVSDSYNMNISILDKVKDKISATPFSKVELPFETIGSGLRKDPSSCNDIIEKSLENEVCETAEKTHIEAESRTSERVIIASHLNAKHNEASNGKSDAECQEDRKLKLGKGVQSHSNDLVPSGERDYRCVEAFGSEKLSVPAAEITMSQNVESVNRKTYPEASKRKSHWDFVLDEMVWMANDFMQERLWKMAAASQVARWITEQMGQPEFHELELSNRQQKIAHSLSSSVMKYWRYIEALLLKDKLRSSQYDDFISTKSEDNVEFIAKFGRSDGNLSAKSEIFDNGLVAKKSLPVQDYAIRFIKYSMAYQSLPKAASQCLLKTGMFDSWEDNFPEESLHYIVPPGAMKAYCLLVESQWDAECKQRLQEHAGALADADAQAAETTEDSMGVSDFGQFDFMNETQSLTGLSPSSRDIGLDNDDTRLQYFPAMVDCPKAIIHKKKRKKIFKGTTSKAEAKASHGFCCYIATAANVDSRNLLSSSNATGRILSGALGSGVGTIPTRRMRSSSVAARQRGGGAVASNSYLAYSSSALVPRSDISSGETNSQQDGLNTLHDCSISDRGLDVDSSGVSGKGALRGVDSPYNNKKKRKAKHHGGSLISLGTPRVGMGMVSSAKKEHLKRKAEQYPHFGLGSPGPESFGGPDLLGVPGSQGLSGQPLKKTKLAKQSSDVNMEAFYTATTTASSQSTMNNACNTNKLKQINNRDRNRKHKSLKGLSHQGIGFPWSSIEDQALLGLVHELGSNWELMSDILSSTSQLKGIFRKPKECKERHAILIERLTGNGGDSPEDSCSSQPHSSNSAVQRGGTRLALHRLHGPMEEDTLKAHVECIVRLHQQYLSLRIQNDLQEQKQQVAIHPSHTICIQQIGLSNLSGGPLTPLELCEHTISNGDLQSHPFALPSAHGNGLEISNILASGSGMHASSAGISLLQGTSNLTLGSGTVPAVGIAATRDVQCMPASMNLLSAEQQQIRYSRIVSGRGLQSQGACVSSGLSYPGVSSSNDCAVPALSPGNSGGMLCGFTRSMSLSRAGLATNASSGVSNIASAGMNMFPSNGIGMPGISSVSPVAAPGPLNVIRRPREGMSMARSPEDQRQMLMQELRQQAVQGNSQAAAALSNLNSSLSSSAMVSSPTQTFAGQQQKQQQLQAQSHLNQNSSINQQAYFLRLANERQQQQQKRLLQQQPSFPTNTARQSPLPVSQSHSLSQHTLPSQSPFLSQQPLQSNALPQQQHVVSSSQPQQHSGPQQQSVLPLTPAASLQSNPSSGTTSSLNSNTQSPQQQQAVSQPSSAQIHLSAQTKQQPQNLLCKNQHMQQQSQQPQQEQHQLKGSSKGNGRGSVQMQCFSTHQAQTSLPQDHQLPNHSMSHNIPGQRLFQSQSPTAVSLGKQPPGISSATLSGQGNQLQGQNSSSVQSAGLSQNSTSMTQQKASSQHFQSKQQFLQHSNSMVSTSAGQSCIQGSISPSTLQQQQQPPVTQTLSLQQHQGTATIQSAASQQQQQRRPMQQSHLTHRRPQQRPPTSNVGMQLSSQLGKTALHQQGPTSSQMQAPPGHGVFQLSSTINNPMSTGSKSSVVPVSSPVVSNSGAPGAAPWRPGHNFAPISAGVYNLTRSSNAAPAQVSSVSSSEMLTISSSANVGIVSTSTNSLTDPVSGGGSSQQSTLQIGVQGQKPGVTSTLSARPIPSPQAGIHIGQQSHVTLQSPNNTSSLGSLPARPVSASSGMFPGATVGVPNGPVSQPGSVSGSMMYTSVQPRQMQSGPMATQGATPSPATRPGLVAGNPGSASAPSSSSVITGSSNVKRS